MPPQKPLPTASDSLPDKSVTRDKLGQGAIVDFIYAANLTGAGADLFMQLLNLQSGVEVEVQQPMALDGTITDLKVKCGSNTYDQPETVTLRKNGADTGISILFPAGSTDPVVTFVPVDFVAGDLFCWHAVSSITTGARKDVETLVIQYNG